MIFLPTVFINNKGISAGQIKNTAARFSKDRKIYPILTQLTKILRHAKIRFVVRAAAFSKHISACLTIIL